MAHEAQDPRLLSRDSEFEGRTVREWVDRLRAEDPETRGEAARQLARCSGQVERNVLDEIEDAIEPHVYGPNRERERRLSDLFFDVRSHVRGIRIRRFGSLVPRPEESEDSDFDLAAAAIAHIWGAANIYAPRHVLDTVLDCCTPGQVAAFALKFSTSEICNGGLHQFFYNATGILCADVIAGCRLIGADEVADIIDEAASRFPPDVELTDHVARQSTVDQIDIDEFRELDRRFYELYEGAWRLMTEYVRNHPGEFFHDSNDDG